MAAIQIPSTYSALGFQEILIENHPQNSTSVTPIQILTLHRPGRHNAFTESMATELTHAFTIFDVDDRVKCIVVTGHGRIFCAGADLATMFRKTKEKINEHRDSYVCD
jgi:enoyl-CoA hydratase/carnithine racemase